MKPHLIFSRILRCLLWLLTLTLFATAFHVKDPHFLSVREQAVPVILFLIFLAGLCFLRQQRKKSRFAGLLVLGIALIVTLHTEVSFRFHRHSVFAWQNNEIHQIGERFIAGFDDWETARVLAEKGQIGGLYISRRNIANETRQSLHDRICTLQSLRQQAGLPRLLIAADQEGGIVSHLTPLLPRREALSTLLTQNNDPDTLHALAYSAGALHGRDLSGIGVNLNFSPVVDLKSGRARSRLDFHSRIEDRAISNDPRMVQRIAQAYVAGMQNEGVAATLKHFPGLGSVATDTHHFSATLSVPLETLQHREWLPFRNIAAATAAVIMLGHVRVPELDPRVPVSFSEPAVRKIIREGWQHQGVLITDDLSMGAAYNHGLCKAVAGALSADVDLLLVSYDHEKIYDALYCAATLLHQGKLDAAQLENSRRRLQKLRARTPDHCV